MAGSGVMSDDYRQDLEEGPTSLGFGKKLEEGFTSKLVGLKSKWNLWARTISLGLEQTSAGHTESIQALMEVIQLRKLTVNDKIQRGSHRQLMALIQDLLFSTQKALYDRRPSPRRISHFTLCGKAAHPCTGLCHPRPY